MNIIVSFWKAVVFWIKDLLARFKFSRGGFVQVPMVLFLALMAVILPLTVALTGSRQTINSNASEGGNNRSGLWVRVVEEVEKNGKNPDGLRAWGHGAGHDENVYNAKDPSLVVLSGDSTWDNDSVWTKDAGGLSSDFLTIDPFGGRNGMYIASGAIKRGSPRTITLTPPPGYVCLGAERIGGAGDSGSGGNLERITADGCSIGVRGSYFGAFVVFRIGKASTSPAQSPSSCNCDNPQDKVKANSGDFNCDGAVKFDDFSVWVFKRITLVDQNENVDCNQNTSFLGEFNSWLTSYLN